MELRESSWHAKYYKLITRGEYLPRDFCTYFWRLIFFLVIGLFLLLFCLLLITSFFSPFILILFDTKLENNEAFMALASIGFSTWAVLIFVSIIRLLAYLIDKRFFVKKIKKTCKPKGPNLIVKAFKDYKAKHCSIIEWKY